MEKVYLKMQHSGVLSVIGGTAGIVIGIIMILSGATLLRNRKKILF